MNVIEQAQQAYAPKELPLSSPRSVEAKLFNQVTAQLQRFSDLKPKDFPKLAAALLENRRLWNALASDVADQSNQLPKELRAKIFYLAEFTELHSEKVLSHSGSVDALIAINTAVIRGLNNQGID